MEIRILQSESELTLKDNMRDSAIYMELKTEWQFLHIKTIQIISLERPSMITFSH